MSIALAWLGAALVLLLLLLPVVARAQEQNDELPPLDGITKGLDTAIQTLRTAGKPPAISADVGPGDLENPPAALVSAGPEFVAAWREYRRACSPHEPPSFQGDLPPGKNVATAGRMPYRRLVEELLDGANIPPSEVLEAFYYATGSFCGNADGGFYANQYAAMVLSDVKRGRPREAVGRMLGVPEYERPCTELLAAMGCDRMKVLVGNWLNGDPGTLESVCAEGSEAAAQIVLRWTELHWDEVSAAREKQRRTNVYEMDKGPQMPVFELLLLLRPDNTVTPETKQRVAGFVTSHVSSPRGSGGWLSRVPAGAEQWLKPLALAALQSPANRDRLAGEKALRAMGDDEARAVLQPAPRYRFFINGKLWLPKHDGMSPDFYVNVHRDANPGKDGATATIERHDDDGVVSVDPDAFVSPELVRRVQFTHRVFSFWHRPGSPTEAWIDTDIPLPVRFGETVDVQIKTVAVTIRPRLLRRPGKKSKAKPIEVEFGRLSGGVEDEQVSLCSYLVPGAAGSLVLSQVQPGDYLLSIRAPGAVALVRQKVRIGPKATILEPVLAVGSDVTLPLAWFGPVIDPALEPLLAASHLRSFSDRLGAFFAVERDGVPLDKLTAFVGEEDSRGQIDKMTLRNLAAGKYRVRLRSTADLRQGKSLPSIVPDHLSHDWEAAEVSFVVKASGPPAFVTVPLQIRAVP